MSSEKKELFKREQRYLVFKISDVEKYLTDSDKEALTVMAHYVTLHRHFQNKKRLECVVVEHDWPEYEEVWRMIQERVESGKSDEPNAKISASPSGVREPAPTDNGIIALDNMCMKYNNGEISLSKLVCDTWNKAYLIGLEDGEQKFKNKILNTVDYHIRNIIKDA